MLSAGDDWADDHHDIEVQDEQGQVLARARLPEGIAGITRLHALIGQFAGPGVEPGEVAAGIETGRGLSVMALRAAGLVPVEPEPRCTARGVAIDSPVSVSGYGGDYGQSAPVLVSQ